MSPSKTVVKRLIISFVIGMGLGAALSEIPFLFLRETARPPKDIVLTIPDGTAEQVARGEQSPTIPDNMTFVVGDTLVVQNEDSVDHKLGPLWIPANSSARLPLGNVESLAFECSFQPSNYFGIDVQEPLTIGTRITGILFAGIPMSVLITLYSFLIIPTKKKTENAPA